MPETAQQLALPPETHRNHYLFSEHYLNELLPQGLLLQAVWREAETGARQTMEAITAKYRKVADALPHYNEAQTEQEWIQPVLDILGHVYHVQPALPGAAGRPDYAFFADEAAKGAATPRLGTAAFWETALAVGDAKRWDRPLDRRSLDGAPDAFTNANPCYQIDYYLRRTSCAWGLVSNGRRWRLYHCDSSYKLDVFYEVDLAQLIERGDVAALFYFYLFFRADAFRPDAEGPVLGETKEPALSEAKEPALSETKGRCWLDMVLAESTAYAMQVDDDLKDRVYEALRLLAQGFLDYPGGVLDPATDLPHVHDACLILLYRLLFLFYAESRGLLPLDNPGYGQQYSLKAIKEDITAKLDAGAVFLPRKATLWDDLKTLFSIIYEGNQTLGVPAYKSGLFDPIKHPFLEEHAIGDHYLAQAIDLLARAEIGQGPGLCFVDYRDLSIHCLGNIYERLLECRLQIANGRQMAGGELRVELVTEREERKATGSYYTPDYIVKYIVEQTLGPLADAQAEAVEKEIEALKARNRGAAHRTRAYKDELARLRNSFAERILALNVVDPAMGSGHFLVEATDYLARRIVEAGVVSEVLVNGDEESELSYWRRRVVERCIYGVDLNPLAVELAKLSLWLATVAKGKPLSFLDHHLRCGNSLIGARVADLTVLPVRKKGWRKTSEVSETSEVSQLAMWDEDAFAQDMSRAVEAMQQIQECESADPASVQEKERLFAEAVERERRKWRDVADLWTATYFGLELMPELYNACVQYAQGKPVLSQAAQAEALLAQAHQVWEDRCFFHWEIEFPEIFFGQHKGNAAGFDAVVGNPPMISSDNIADSYKASLPSIWPHTAVHRYDLACTFLELAHTILKQQGKFALLVPSHLLTGEYFTSIREFLLSNFQLEVIVDLKERFFAEVANPICLIVATKSKSLANRAIWVGELKSGEQPINESLFELDRELVTNDYLVDNRGNRIKAFRFIVSPGFAKLCSRVTGELLLCDLATVCDGVQTADVLKVLMTQNPDDEFKYVKALRRGGDIPCRYGYAEWTGWWMLKPEYARHLKRPGFNYDSPARMRCFQTPKKIILRQTEPTIVATIEDTGLYFPNSIFQIRNEHLEMRLEYLLAVLNSKFVRTLYGLTTRVTGTTKPQLYLNVLKAVPIRRIYFTTPAEERARLVSAGSAEAAEWIEGPGGASVTFSAFGDSKLGRWLDARLSVEPEQSDVVHDLLAFLSERMIEMNKQKQVEVKGFLDWLVGYTGRPIDQWALKSSLRRYYEHNWAEMQRILKRNQRQLSKVKLYVDVCNNGPSRKIRETWGTSMETLRPLLMRIEVTDRLIDLVVYRLYGLSEDEIMIVEGNQ